MNIGSGNNSKTINVGTGSAGNSINIGTDNTTVDTVTIGSALDALSISSTGLNLTTGGALTGVSSIDTITTSATAIGFAGVGSVSSAGANSITIDSETTGAVNIGTGASAKTITMGNITGVSALILNSGSGDITLDAGGTGVSGKIQIGTVTGKSTADLLVLDAGSADPAGVNGGMYYSTATNKFRCYENGAWRNCSGSQPQQTVANIVRVTVATAATLIKTFSITPSTATGDVYVSANLFSNSLSSTDQTITAQIRSGTTCAGTLLASGTSTLTGVTAGEGPALFASTLVLNPGASAQNYAICALSSTNNGASIGGIATAMVIDTGADLAEMYTSNDTSIQPGDVVSYDPSLKAGIAKSTKSYDQNVLGIVSTQPGVLIGKVEKEGTGAYPVALSGRVPVKVSSKNGSIQVGDYLTSSDIPGVAVKADSDGVVIGQALSSFDGNSVNSTGVIVAFVKNTYYSAGYSIKEQAVLLGDIYSAFGNTASATSSSTSTDTGLSKLVDAIQKESIRNPIVVIGDKISGNVKFLTDFVSARVTAIRGYFDEVFAKKVHTDQVCVKKSDGSEICVNGDQLDTMVRKANLTPNIQKSTKTSSSTSAEIIDPTQNTTDTSSTSSASVGNGGAATIDGGGESGGGTGITDGSSASSTESSTPAVSESVSLPDVVIPEPVGTAEEVASQAPASTESAPAISVPDVTPAPIEVQQ